MAQTGRKPREPLPKGEDAEKELERQRRNQRRALRRAKRAAEEKGEVFVDPTAPPPPAPAFEGIPDGEQLKKQFWDAYSELGGHAGLVAWGRRYPKEFYAIWARLCLPKAGPGEAAPNSLESMLAQLGDD